MYMYSYNDMVTLREIIEELNEAKDLTRLFAAPLASDSSDRGRSAPLVGFNSKVSGAKGSSTKTSKGKQQTKDSSKSKPVSTTASSGSPGSAISKKKLAGLLLLQPTSLPSTPSSADRSPADSPSNLEAHVHKPDMKEMPALVIGRNSKQNERVTFELAREHHLWFHVQVMWFFCGIVCTSSRFSIEVMYNL